jgi:hypothetical protein
LIPNIALKNTIDQYFSKAKQEKVEKWKQKKKIDVKT